MGAPSDARCLCIAATGVAPDSADAALPAGLSPQPDRGSPPCHHNTVSHNTVTVYRSWGFARWGCWVRGFGRFWAGFGVVWCRLWGWFLTRSA